MRPATMLLPALLGLSAMSQTPQASNAVSTPAPATAMKLAWTDVVTLKPETLVGAFDGDRVYYQNSFQHLVARDAHSGKTVWDVKAPGDPGMLASASKDLLLNLDGSSLLHALDSATGQERWRAQLQSVSSGGAGVGSIIVVDGPMTTPVALDGRIYLGTYGTSFGKGRTGSLYALDAVSGKVIWSLETEDGIENDLIFKDGRIYAGGIAAFYALDAATGKVVWKASLRSDNQWSSQLMNGKLYVSSGHFGSSGSWFSGTLYCLDPETGKQIWTYDIGGPSPVCGSDGVLVGVKWGTFGGSKLVGLDASDGKEIWIQKEKKTRQVEMYEGQLVRMTGDGFVEILDIHSGKELMTIHTGGALVIGKKAFVVGKSKSGSELVELDLKTCKVVAVTAIPGILTSRPAFVGGRVAVLTDKPSGSLSVYE